MANSQLFDACTPGVRPVAGAGTEHDAIDRGVKIAASMLRRAGLHFR